MTGECLYQSENFQLVESIQKFEDLLVTNNLFVDYFNAFLLNPGLGEKLKFNFVSGDLELIDDSQPEENDRQQLVSKSEPVYGNAVVVKKKLETQLKSIIKTHSASHRNVEHSRISFVGLPRIKSSKKDEILIRQVDNHSFKDIDLIQIQPSIPIDKIEFKNNKNDSLIPVLNTTYKVNVLKKPFSMKWLFFRRLSLFLQSDLYNEFKLAMILSQCQVDDARNKKLIKFVQIEIDKEMIEMNFNPFEAKNDLQRLQKFYEENKSDLFERSVEKLTLPSIVNKSSGESPSKQTTKEALASSSTTHTNKADENIEVKPAVKTVKSNENKREKKTLIKSNVDMYESLKEEKSKTSLLTVKSGKMLEKAELVEKSDIDKNAIEITKETKAVEKKIESVDALARDLVTTILSKSLDVLKSASQTSLLVEDEGPKRGKVLTRESTLSHYSIMTKSNSRLGDPDMNADLKSGLDIDLDENEHILLEFEDEPYELTNPADSLAFRRAEIENFKLFLKENDAYLFYKLWLDIERLKVITNTTEKIIHLKNIKLEYNRPQILNRFNRDAFINSINKKNKYDLLYDQYANNIDFWSLEYLTKPLHQRVLNFLINYWWPKFQMKMSDFKNYMTNKYPVYSLQKSMIDSKREIEKDLDVQNIERSIRSSKNSDRESDKNSDRSLKDQQSKLKKPLRKLAVDQPKSAKKSSKESTVTSSAKKQTDDQQTGLEGYDLGEYLTSPPVGWKRPASTATVMFKKLIDNKQNRKSSNDDEAKRKRMDKEIYLEAIYNDDVAGQIFKKYLISRNKSFAINRLKCLQELMKYKELFYGENFNQESVKNFAFDIFRKYIAVSGQISIDCPKADRLQLHALFIDLLNADRNIFGFNARSSSPVNSTPVYEDTFNSIEEFLINALYDDWKVFFETEKSFFNHNEIENIERTINIRSKQVDELINKGLVRMNSAQSLKNASRRASNSDGNSFVISTREFSRENLNNQQQQHHMSLKELVNSREFEMFKMFLQSKNALIDILFWQDLEAYGQLDPIDDEQVEVHARMLKTKYLNKKYFFNKNGPIDEEAQNIILEKIGGWNKVLEDRPSNALIKLVKKNIENKIKTVWIPLYYNSDYKAKAKLNERTLIQDVVDDVMFLKNGPKSNQATSKRNRWLYSSTTVINFCKSLKNTFTTKLFSKFLSYKMYSNPNVSDWDNDNNNLVNNLHFLVDVQEYKDLCQKSPEDERAIIFKMNHIIDSYINNRILPKIRIDINNDLANEILYQKDYLSPYLFLEANLIIFNALMPYWLEFNQMRFDSDIDILDEFRTFKRLKDYKSKRATSAESTRDDSLNNLNDHSIKWRYNQYVKALNTQLIL